MVTCFVPQIRFGPVHHFPIKSGLGQLSIFRNMRAIVTTWVLSETEIFIYIYNIHYWLVVWNISYLSICWE